MTTNRIYLLSTFLVMILFSQVSNAIIVSSYTALFDDGSRLVVDLKGYDYGKGSYYAPPINWNPHNDPSNELPYTESFDTYFYPSSSLKDAAYWDIEPGTIEDIYSFGEGLHFKVDENNSVSMTSLKYLFSHPDWSISDSLINLYYDDYNTNFSGGFFKTFISPSKVGEPGILIIMVIGMAGLVLARQRRPPAVKGFLAD